MSRGFSLFEWIARRTTTDEDSPIASAPLAQARHGVLPERFNASVHALQHWCAVNEQILLERHAEGASVYAGFERFSNIPDVSRYRLLNTAVRSLTIFGYADVPLPIAATAVALPVAHPLTREWFLAIGAPNYTALIVARDVRPPRVSSPVVKQNFSGIALHDRQIVSEACERLSVEAAKLVGKGKVV